MKKIDLYIIKKFLTTFFFILVLLMSIAIVFDVSERIDDFLRNDAPLGAIIFDYYVNFFLYFGNLFSFLLIFIAVIWFTSKMASRSEIVAILSSGVSFPRMLWPYFLAATLLTVTSLILNHEVLPRANVTRLGFVNTYLKNPYRNRGHNIHKRMNDTDYYYVEKFNASKNIGYKFTLEKWEGEKLTYKLKADFARFDTTTTVWTLENWFERRIDGPNELHRRGVSMDTTWTLLPRDFGWRNSSVEMMTTSELEEFIEQEIIKGSSNVPRHLVEYHKRTAWPIATYILTLIAVTFSSRKVRGGLGLHLAIGLLVAVGYIFIMQFTSVYASKAGLAPWLAVWLPNFFFAIIAVLLYRLAPK